MKKSSFGLIKNASTKDLGEKMTPQAEKIIEEFQEEMAEGKVSKPYDNVEDFLIDLKKSAE